MGTGGPFPGIKRGRGVTLTTHLHLVPRIRMGRIYTSFPSWRLHGGSGTAFLRFISYMTRDCKTACSGLFQVDR